MAPEYSKAAVGLSPMVPLYAVDCDNDGNKRLCAEQGVQGFPTIKVVILVFYRINNILTRVLAIPAWRTVQTCQLRQRSKNCYQLLLLGFSEYSTWCEAF